MQESMTVSEVMSEISRNQGYICTGTLQESLQVVSQKIKKMVSALSNAQDLELGHIGDVLGGVRDLVSTFWKDCNVCNMPDDANE